MTAGTRLSGIMNAMAATHDAAVRIIDTSIIRVHQHADASRLMVERFFNKIKQYRRVATRYNKRAANDLASSSLHQSGFGCALMSPRPSSRS